MSSSVHAAMGERPLWGLVARFAGADELLAAAREAHAAGYRRMEAYSPFPIHTMHEVLGQRNTRLPWVVFAMGALGCAVGFGFQVWTSAFDYPLNVGGRPLVSWPAFMPVTFEVTVLLAAITTVVGMLWSMGLPTPHHPMFDAKDFDRSTTDAFFLCIEVIDRRFDAATTRAFLEGLRPLEVTELRYAP